MFALFVQYEWSSNAKGVADQLEGVLHVTIGCDSVTVVDIGRETTSSSSSTSLFSLFYFFLAGVA